VGGVRIRTAATRLTHQCRAWRWDSRPILYD